MAIVGALLFGVVAAMEVVFGHLNIALAAMLDGICHSFRRQYAIGVSFLRLNSEHFHGNGHAAGAAASGFIFRSAIWGGSQGRLLGLV